MIITSIKGHKIASYLKLHTTRIVKLSSASIYKEDTIKVAHQNVNYLKVGEGAHNILFLPGYLGSIWTDYKPQIEGFDKNKFTVVVWEPPGFGKSRPLNRAFSPDFFEKQADTAAQFMDVLNIKIYSLLGWGVGGVTGLLMASRRPNNIDRLVVWGTGSYLLPSDIEGFESIRDLTKWPVKKRKVLDDLYGADLPELWEHFVDGLRNIYNEKKGELCSAELKNIKCPTLILYGQKNPVIDRSHVSHLHANIINSKVHLYPDGKHNVHLSYVDDFNKRVQEFLLEKNI